MKNWSVRYLALGGAAVGAAQAVARGLPADSVAAVAYVIGAAAACAAMGAALAMARNAIGRKR